MRKIGIIVLLLAFFAACTQEEMPMPQDSPFSVQIPPQFPVIEYPEGNMPTMLRVELGKRLFFDERLSEDLNVSCASCHLPEKAFTDGLALSVGFEGREGFRNSPSLLNVAWQQRLFADGGVGNLELQVLAPIEDPNEFHTTAEAALDRINEDASYRNLAQAAYGRDEVDLYVLTRAIANYERTLIAANSNYDAYVMGQYELTVLEEQGMELFFGNADCASCHSGPLFTDQLYHNIGLYADYEDIGRERVSNLLEDRGKFKTPSLRNVAITAPYMHDGSIATLAEVIEHFDQGGVGHQNQDPRVQALDLNTEQKEALLAFLYSLTDQEFK